MSRRLRLLLAFATIYVVWGSTYLAIARAVETIPPLAMTAVRSVAAGAVLYGWARWRGVARPTASNWRAALVTGAMLIAGAYGLIAWAEVRIDSGVTALLAATSPLWAVGMSFGWRGAVRPGVTGVAGALLGLAGVALLMGVGAAGPLARGPALAVVGSALLWSLGSFVARGSSLPASLPLTAGMQLLAGGALLGVLSAATGESAGGVPLASGSVVALLYLIVFGSLAGYSAYAYALRATSPVLVTTHAFVNPLIAVLLGWAVGGEAVSGGMLVAGALIALAVVLITLDRARGARRVAAPGPSIRLRSRRGPSGARPRVRPG